MDPLVEIAGIAVVVVGVILTLLLRTVMAARIPAQLIQRPVPVESPPETFRPLFDRADGELRALDFEPWFWAMVDYEPDIQAGPRLVRYYRHATEPVLARVHPPHTVMPSLACLTTFLTRLPDGRLLATANRIPEIYPRHPEHLVIGRILNVDTAAEQCRIHREEMDKKGGPWLDWSDSAETLRTLNKFERDNLNWAIDEGYALAHPEGGYRLGFGSALSFLRRLVRQPQPAASKEAASERLEAVLYRNWALNNRLAPPLSVQLALFAGSAALFVLAGGLYFDWQFALVLLFVIAFHEGGHFLAMKLFGYGSLQMLMLPLVGGVAMGQEAKASAANRAFVSLMGPLPGIVLGWALLLLSFSVADTTWLAKVAVVLLVVNYLNLLPIMPLDGGHLVKALIPARWLSILIIFELAAVPVLLALAWFLRSPILAVIAIIPFIGALTLWRERRVLNRLQAHWREHPPTTELDRIQGAFAAYAAVTPNPPPLTKKVKTIADILRTATLKPASAVSTLLLLSTYLGAFAVPILVTPIDTTLLLSSLIETSDYPEIDRQPWRDAAARMAWPELIDATLVEEARYYTDIFEQPARDVLYAPAAPAAIDAAETRLHFDLPAGYEQFLSHSNGLADVWSQGDSHWLQPVEKIGYCADMLPDMISELRELESTNGSYLYVIDAATDQVDDLPMSASALAGAVCVGVPDQPWTLVALDTSSQDGGEPNAFYLDGNFGVYRYPSFRAYFEDHYVRMKTENAYREEVQ